MMPLSKNQPVLALPKPWPNVWANRPSTPAEMTSRPRLARTGPEAQTLRLAQVALRAKKKAARLAANKVPDAHRLPVAVQHSLCHGVIFSEGGTDA